MRKYFPLNRNVSVQTVKYSKELLSSVNALMLCILVCFIFYSSIDRVLDLE